MPSSSAKEEKSWGKFSGDGGVVEEAACDAAAADSVDAKRREETKAWEERMPATPILLPETERTPIGDLLAKVLPWLRSLVPNCLGLPVLACRGIERTGARENICCPIVSLRN